MKDIIIKADDLYFSYDDEKSYSLNGMRREIERGKKVAFMGANGAGKSTFFLCLNGIHRPTAGTLYVDGEAVDYSKKGLLNLRSKVGIVFQDPDNQLFSASVFQEISFGALNIGMSETDAKTAVEQVIDTLEITPFMDKPTHSLSGGQKKQVSIADVLVMNDASQDKTNHVTKKRNHTVITHVFNLGYGSGLQLGYKYAVRKGYRYVIQMDADGQHDVCNLLEIYKELQKEDENGKLPDIVLGSRFMEGSSGFSVSFAKKIAFVWFRIMLKTGTGRRITDPTTGLQGLNWRTFLFYSKYNNFDDKYPDANMLMQMLLLGFRVREIPAVMHVRTTGVSMHSGLKPVLYMFRMTFSILAVWIREKILKMDEDKIHELEKYDE